ncbi:unnamed protein product [Auanema sp. JU1783]|nr:unnamed protein product [Auanema sp. JU1783]
MTLVYQPAGKIPFSNQSNHSDEVCLYWKRMQLLSVFQEPGIVSSVDFCPTSKPIIATTSSVRLSLFDGIVCEPISLFSRFKKAVHGVRFRNDGKLLAIGGDEGKLRVFDCEKAPLRSFKVCDSIIRVTDFTQSGKTVVSMADDGMVKFWDLASMVSKPVQEFSAHSDLIRAGLTSSINDHIVISGGYDHKIKLWDTRCCGNDGASIEIDVGLPVEKLVYFPGENLIGSAAGNTVKIWDLTNSGHMLANLQHHHKTVTSLNMASNAFISAAIDKRINFYNLSNFSLSYSMSVAAPVYSLAVSRDNQRIAVGMGNLLSVHVKTYKTFTEKTSNIVAPAVSASAVPPKPVTKSTEKNREPRLSRVDTLLKAYRHGEVIHNIFCKNFITATQHQQTVAWLRQLIHRNVLKGALAGQSVVVQTNILKFLQKHMMKTNYFEILSSVALAFFEVHAAEDVDPKCLELMKKLDEMITKELHLQSQICQTIGALELVLHNSKKKLVPKSSTDDNVFEEPLFKSVRI